MSRSLRSLASYIGAWNGPIKWVRRGGIYFDVPPQCSTPDAAHGQWVHRYGYSSSLVENILCNKLNIQNPSLWNIGIYCTLGREYFPRPSASENIPTLGFNIIIIPIFHAEGLNIKYYIYVCSRKKYLNRTLEIDSPFQTLTVGLLVEFID